MNDKVWHALATGTRNALVGYFVISAFVLLLAGGQ